MSLAFFAWGCASSRHEASWAESGADDSKGAVAPRQSDAPKVTASRLENVPPDVIAARLDGVLASGDAERLERARTALLDLASKVSSNRWCEEHRERLSIANALEDWPITGPQFEAQLALWQLQSLTFVLVELERLGGARVRAFAFSLLEDTRSPVEHRQLALGLLSRAIASNELTDRTRLDALAKQIPPPAAGVQTTNANAVVTGLRARFKRCYDALISSGVRERYNLLLRIEVGADGSVSSVSHSGEAPELLTTCVHDVTSRARFIQPKGGRAVIQVPVTFVP